jgi:hypothetical protein
VIDPLSESVKPLQSGSAFSDETKWVDIELKIRLPKVSPQGVGWREALDGIRGLVAYTFCGKVTNEHVEVA